MVHPEDNEDKATEAMNAQFLSQLRTTFDKLPNTIELVLFTDKAKEDVFCEATRQVVRAFRSLTDKISIREYDLSHKLAEKYGVTASPTLLIAPDKYNIRWLGAPMGEEARTFLETLILVGMGKAEVSDQSAKVIKGIEGPREVKIFVSPTCPYCPQQAFNGLKAAIMMPELVSLEIIDIQCRQDLADLYNAHSVPQTFANETLIGLGAQTEELFFMSLKKLEPQTVFIPEIDAAELEVDLVIVGGGPAGLSAGIYAVRGGLNAAVIERDALGGQVATTPVVENYPGFNRVGGKTLVDIMVSHALEYVQIFQGEEVIDIQPGDPIVITTTRRRFKARTVLLATGATHKHLEVDGEKRLSGRGVSYCATCDGPLFKNRRVIIVGGGNSAVTEALYLHNMGVDVTLVHRRDALRAQEVLTKQLEERGIPILFDTEVKAIQGKERVESVVLYNNRTHAKEVFKTDGVFISIGYTPTNELAAKTGITVTPEGYIQRDEKHRTNIPGIYSAGDVEGGYKQIVTATGMGSEAAMAIFEDLIHPYWLKDEKEKKQATG
jgi:thioredoxin reductase (NADPH)